MLTFGGLSCAGRFPFDSVNSRPVFQVKMQDNPVYQAPTAVRRLKVEEGGFANPIYASFKGEKTPATDASEEETKVD